MLQNIRNGIAKFLVYLIFGILILSFALWGTTDFFGKGSVQTVVAEVGGKDITAQFIERKYKRQIDALRKRGISESQARKFGLLDNVIERVLDASIFDLAAGELGLTVSTATIESDIKDRFGKIGSVQFDQLLRENGYTLQQYEAERRNEIPRMQMLETFSSGVKGPEKIVNYLYKWQAEERSATVLKFLVNKNKVPNPKRKDLIEFHRENKRLFTSPEYRKLTFVHIDPNKVAKSIIVDEKELKDLYKNRISDFTQGEKREISQILFASEAEAKTAYSKIKKGLDFNSVADLVANQDKKITQLGAVTREDLPTMLAETVFQLTTNQISEPIKDDFGYRILRVNKVIPKTVKPFSEVKKELATEIRKEQALEDVIRISNLLEDGLGDGMSLEDAATAQGLEVQRIAAITQNGLDRNGHEIDGLPGAPFLKIAFDSSEGEDSFLTETIASGFFVLRVSGITESALIPLRNIENRVRSSWLEEKRKELTRLQAKKLTQMINDGEKFNYIASLVRAKPFKVGPTTRFNRVDGIPRGLISKLFDLKNNNKAVFSAGENQYFVARLTKISSVDGQIEKKALETIKKEIKMSMASDILTQFQSAIRKEYKVSIKQNALKQFFSKNEEDDGVLGAAP